MSLAGVYRRTRGKQDREGIGLTGHQMEASRIMITSITKKAATILLTGAIRSAWALNSAGARWYAGLDRLAWVPSALWKLCARLTATGAVLEAFAERVAPRLGIDMTADVLEPLLDRACRV